MIVVYFKHYLNKVRVWLIRKLLNEKEKLYVSLAIGSEVYLIEKGIVMDKYVDVNHAYSDVDYYNSLRGMFKTEDDK